MSTNEQSERAAFEAWMTEDGAWPKAVVKNAAGHYLLAQTASAWRVWQARAALSNTPFEPAMRKATRDEKITRPGLYELPTESVVASRQLAPEPTLAELNSVCMSYRHDFGLMSEDEQESLRFSAEEWLRAWRKEDRFVAPQAQSHAAPSADAQDARRYRWLRDWLERNGQLVCIECQPSKGEKVGPWWVFRRACMVDGTSLEGYGKTEEAAIDAAIAAQEVKP